MAQHIPEFPEDLLVDILARLPAKCLSRLKLVSTSWYCIISKVCLPKLSPPCANARLSGYIFCTVPAGARMNCTGYDEQDWLKYASQLHTVSMNYGSICLPLPYEEKMLQFQDCCNGLLLLSLRSVAPTQYLVFNPTTRECLTLPIMNSVRNHSRVFSAGLAFDPCYSSNYKIVCFSRSIFEASCARPPTVDVFCSALGKWCSDIDIHLDPAWYGIRCVERFIYCYGSMYCLSPRNCIICINLSCLSCEDKSGEEKKAYGIPLPVSRPGFRSGFLGTSRGHLYYSCDVGPYIKFWLLEQGGEFVLKHSMHDNALYGRNTFVQKVYKKYHHETCQILRPFAVDRLHDDEEIVFGTPYVMLRYSIRSKQAEVIYEINKDSRLYSGSWHVYPHHHCPLLLNSAKITARL